MNNISFNLTDCSSVLATTPNSPFTYLQYMKGTSTKNFTDIKEYTISKSYNCCTADVIKVPVRYAFTASVTSCNVLTINSIDNLDLTFRILGINPLFVNKIEVSSNNIVFTNTTYTATTGGFTYNYSINNYPIVFVPYTHYLRITHVNGQVYLLTITYDWTVDPCVGVTNIFSVVYPSLPANVSISSSNELSLNTLYGTPVMQIGVYELIICEVQQYPTAPLLRSTCIQNNFWLACDVKCAVINKLVQCKDSDILFFFDALNMSNDCENITYADKCALYEVMYNKLKQDDCYDPFDDCNCGNSKDSIFKVTGNKTNNKTNVKDCGCHS